MQKKCRPVNRNAIQINRLVKKDDRFGVYGQLSYTVLMQSTFICRGEFGSMPIEILTSVGLNKKSISYTSMVNFE